MHSLMSAITCLCVLVRLMKMVICERNYLGSLYSDFLSIPACTDTACH